MKTKSTDLFGPVDRQLIKLLFHANEEGIDIYTLHSDFSYSPAQIVRSLRRLSSLGIVDFDRESVRFTKGGREWIIRHRKSVFTAAYMPWKEFPDRLRRHQKADARLPKPREFGKEFISDFRR